MARRPTLADLAQAAGVSPATVDRVLNGRQNVRAATAARVLAAAQEIGFHAAEVIRHRLAQDRPEYRLGVILQKPDQPFYRNFRTELDRAAAGHAEARLRLRTEFLTATAPGEIVARLERLAGEVQAVAMTAPDDPALNEPVAALRARGVPVFALLSDFAQGLRESYLGLNNLRVGRCAAWMIARGLARTPPDAPPDAPVEIAVMVGGHRWHGHDLRETGFRSFFRQAAPEVRVLDRLINLDTPDLAREASEDLMARHPGLRAIYCAGGGMEGVIAALRARRPGLRPDLVVNELTDESRRALTDGIASMVIATPLPALCDRLVALMVAAVRDGPAGTPGQHFLPMEVHLAESL